MDIMSKKNPLIKRVKGLLKRKNRDAENLFIVEGIKVVEEAFAYDMEIEHIFYTDNVASINGGDQFIKTIENSNVDKYLVSEEVFKEISDTKTPQGVVGVLRKPERDFEKIDLESLKKTLYLDGIQDPGNMGTIIRTAEAFAFDCIFIKKGTVDPYSPKVVRATMGSIYRMPIYYLEDNIGELQYLKDNGFKLYTTYLEGSIPIKDVDYSQKFIITIGNESSGVLDDVVNISDKLVKIPMDGKAESLNAAIASSIIMYEASRM